MCELCSLVSGDIKTHKYYECRLFICVDCETCNTPMLVAKRHTQELNDEEKFHAEVILAKIFPEYKWREEGMRKILDHWHWHIVKKED